MCQYTLIMLSLDPAISIKGAAAIPWVYRIRTLQCHL